MNVVPSLLKIWNDKFFLFRITSFTVTCVATAWEPFNFAYPAIIDFSTSLTICFSITIKTKAYKTTSLKANASLGGLFSASRPILLSFRPVTFKRACRMFVGKPVGAKSFGFSYDFFRSSSRCAWFILALFILVAHPYAVHPGAAHPCRSHPCRSHPRSCRGSGSKCRENRGDGQAP